MEQVVITGDKVEITARETVKTVSLDQFLQEITNAQPIRIPIVPTNTIGILSGIRDSAFVIEQKPITRSMVFKSGTGLHRIPYMLHFPYMYWVITIQNSPISIREVELFFAKKKVISEESQVGWMPFPNVRYDSGRKTGKMCTGEVRIGDNQHFSAAIDELLSRVWGSDFNRDYFMVESAGYKEYLPSCLTDAQKKHATPDKIAKATEKEEDEESVLKKMAGQINPTTQYLYGWHTLSSKTDLNDFLSLMEFTITNKYGDILTQVQRTISNV
jgi:hypothetical protein